MSSLNTITIVVSNIKTADKYQARSYPHDDFDRNGKVELYETPVYKVFIKSGDRVKEWKALRFMPYWNNPSGPVAMYKTKGWVNSGLKSMPLRQVTYYNPSYGTHNRYSPYSGAIQIWNSFLIHAGPQNVYDLGWGAAGCVEIIGNFDEFKNDIKTLSGSSQRDSHQAILDLVAAGKLFVKVDYASPPNLKDGYYGEYDQTTGRIERRR
ncbi:MAG TPA: hypothetical protein VHY08_00385 [Bacillota bacterium]|nr:hypothetical protein [Bacillota bacterium]